ncbi:ABC transporter permease, partial [Georgenia sp. 10Sc9-8]|nr:ABC transporter permease [Georgenia halotolerans]
MTASDLRQRVRDRSVLIFALVVPLSLMFVFNLIFGDTDGTELDPVTVAAAAPADDELAETLLTVLDDVDGLDVTVDRVAADEAADRAREGRADLGVVVPDGFGDAVRQGTGPVVDVTESGGTGIEADLVLSVMHGVLDRFAAGAVTAAAAEETGLPPEQHAALGQRTVTEAPAMT